MESSVSAETIMKVEKQGTARINCVDKCETLTEHSDSIAVHDACGYVSVKTETKSEQKIYNLLPCNEQRPFEKISLESNNSKKTSNDEREPAFKPWTLEMDSSRNNEKLDLGYTFSKPYMCGMQSPFKEDIFFQLDYKTRNKLKTKQRRMNPSYRNQERIRQRTVMQLKRQDPNFRAEEREKGRSRMRIKRLDPVFRSKERERQRERMKLKRQDPDFREREREQQKNRIHEKRLDPDFREREKSQGRLRTNMKQNKEGTLHHSEGIEAEFFPRNAAVYNHHLHAVNSIITDRTHRPSMENTNVFEHTEHLDNEMKPIISKEGENFYDSFHCITPCVLNFRFYNNVKDHNSSSIEKAPTAALCNIVKDSGHQHNALCSATSQKNITYLVKQENVHLEHSPKPKVIVNCKSNKSSFQTSTEDQQSIELSVGEQKCVS